MSEKRTHGSGGAGSTGTTGATDRVEDALLGHEYDGIQEYDNALPNWWLATFYLAILFSIGYWSWYHIYEKGASPAQLHAEAVAADLASRPVEVATPPPTAEEILAASKDPEVVAAGQQIFTVNCVACHGAHAEGKIGPNLTDAYWIHGGTPEDVYKVVTEGVVAKGMVPWKDALGPTRIRQVVAYMWTLRNTNVAGKAPEGQKAE